IFAVAVTFGAILAVGTVVSLVSAASEESVVAAAADVAVTTQGVQFRPTEIVLTADSSGVWIDNKDGVRHTFTIDDLGIDLELPGNTSRRVDIEAPGGSYAVFFSVPGHEDMLATLKIEG
ncbi:MAG: cupredoxin domain-containing protein, partial [Acidimicrobiia bacterium]